MIKRFTYFGFGFALGLILLFFFLSGKRASCNFFPNERMLEILRNKDRAYTEDVQTLMVNYAIDSADIANLLITGDIDFSKSKTRQEPCRYYWVDGYMKERSVSLYIENCDSLITIQELHLNTK